MPDGGFRIESAAHRAERMALDLSEISELLTYTLCALRYALCAIASSIVTRNAQPRPPRLSGSRWMAGRNAQPATRSPQPDLALEHLA